MKLLPLLITLLSSLSFAAPYSAGELTSKWGKDNINICWLDDTPINRADFAEETWKVITAYEETTYLKASEELKSKIQALMDLEFTSARTGIHFSGWKSCKDSPESDVQILIGDKSRKTLGHATLGRLSNIMVDYSLMDKDDKGYVYLNIMKRKDIKMNAQESVLITALHEFGHLAGLRHEHIQSSQCAYGLREKPRAKTTSFSVYDASSIMDYCLLDFLDTESSPRFYVKSNIYDRKPTPVPVLPVFPAKRVAHLNDETIFTSQTVSEGLQYFKFRIGLSLGDLHGLKCMYVFNSKQFAEKCHKDFKP